MNLQVGKPVSGADFTGREKEIRELVQMLNMGQSIVVIAPRRFGKTSVILNTLEQLRAAGQYTAYVDIFSIADIKRLSEHLSKAILENKKLDQIVTSIKRNLGDIFKNIEFKSTIEDYEFLLKFAQTEINQWELLENTLDFAEKFSMKNSKRLVVGIDEFGDIEKLGSDDLAKLLRAKMQQQKNVSYLFSGSYETVMNQLFTTVKSPFYRFARVVYLGNIDRQSFETFFIAKLNEAKIKVSKSLISEILNLTKGHPYYSSLFLQQWLLNAYDIELLKEGAFEWLLNKVIDIENPYLEKLWEDVSTYKDQRMLVVSLAENKKPYSVMDSKRVNISRTIQKVESKSLILKTPDGWQFSDPLFEMWMKMKVLN
jgi:hypothetical protein